MTVPKVLLLALLLLAAKAQITFGSPLNNYLQTIGSQTCCSDQTITVYGSATIQAAPDTASISLQVTVNGDTVNAAVAQLTTKISSVISVLTSNGLTSANYQTSSLSVYPNTTYSNGVSTVVGQIASQSLTVTVPLVNSNTSLLGKLIDGLAAVNGIILNGVSFDVVDKTDELALARGNAFSNAKKKAQDYAASLQLCIGQLVTVIDSYSSAPVIQKVDAPQFMMSSAMVATPTTINAGTIPISYNVEVIYAFN
jgi:uncharacterized protein